MEFSSDIIIIIGHNGSWRCDDGTYEIFFGGYQLAEEYNGTIVKEEEVELAINHEVLHCLIDYLGEDASKLDNIWCMYTDAIPLLVGLKEVGLGY